MAAGFVMTDSTGQHYALLLLIKLIQDMDYGSTDVSAFVWYVSFFCIIVYFKCK